MTLEEVKRRLQFLQKSAKDPERFHLLEDELYSDFVKAIADDTYNSKIIIKIIATEILKSKEIDCCHWCG